MIIAAADVEN